MSITSEFRKRAEPKGRPNAGTPRFKISIGRSGVQFWWLAIASAGLSFPALADTSFTPSIDVGKQSTSDPHFVGNASPIDTPTLHDFMVPADTNFVISEIQIEGMLALGDEEVAEVRQRYLGQSATSETLESLRQELTLVFVEAGYFTSGFVLTGIDESTGTVLLRGIEGRVSEITVSGLENRKVGAPSEAYVKRVFEKFYDTPIEAKAIQQAFSDLSTDQSFSVISGKILPTEQLGFAAVQLEAVPGKPYYGNLTIANDRSPAVGAERVSVNAGFRNIIGYGDHVALELGKSEGWGSAHASTHSPIPWFHGEVHAEVSITEADIIEEPFSELDLLSQTARVKAGASVAIHRASGLEARIGADLERVEAKTKLLGRALSISPGSRNGRTEYNAARFHQSFVAKGERQFLALQSTFSLGLDAISPEFVNDFTPPENFSNWRGALQHGWKVTSSGQQVRTSAEILATGQPAFSTEKYAIGGPGSVSGYRANSVVSDGGARISIAYQVPFEDFGIAPDTGVFSNSSGRWSASILFESARGWNYDQKVVDGEDLSSIGIGVDYQNADKFSASLSLSGGISGRRTNSQDDLQDYGVVFRISRNVF